MKRRGRAVPAEFARTIAPIVSMLSMVSIAAVPVALPRSTPMTPAPVLLPDGKPFPFWDDRTTYARVYHVAAQHPAASDTNPGTAERPFRTIGRAAALLAPGEKVVVHAGVYRECVRPARGGTGPEAMIAYEAAPGEEVCVRGSEAWPGPFVRSAGWSGGADTDAAPLWMGDLPPQWFVGYQPFLANNMSAEYTTFTRDWSAEETQRMQLRRGQLFANGQPLRQVFRHHELLKAEGGAFWVEDPGLRLHFRLPPGLTPDTTQLEVTAREQVFAPAVRGLGYLRVNGFTLEHAADGIPVPQRALLSTYRGHHWLIERNRLRHANTTGLDVGNESWHASGPPADAPRGGHIIRGNHVSDCGLCGMAGVGQVHHTLVEDNIIERVGALDMERIWESGGLKFHVCHGVLIRRNYIRHLQHAPGLWLDYLNVNCRITANVFADIEAINGGVYLEVSHAPNQIDHNVFWDIRAPAGRAKTGPGVNVDTGEQAVVEHNFFGQVRDGYAVKVHLLQAGRVVGGRVGLGRRHRVSSNVFYACPHRILFARREENTSDHNYFDARQDACSLCLEFPAPESLVDLAAWQQYCGLDLRSRQGGIAAEFDAATGELRVTLAAALPPEVANAGPVPLRVGPQTVRPW